MIDTNYVPLVEFCRQFSLNIHTIEVAKCTGRLPERMFAKDRKTLYVDSKYTVRRIEFRKKMWLEAHDLYFKIMEIFPNQITLARFMAKLDGGYSSHHVWNTWLTSELFCIIEDRRLMLTPRAKDYKFVRFARWLLAIHSRIGLDFKEIKAIG